MEIRGFTVSHATAMKKKDEQLEKDLLSEIAALENTFLNDEQVVILENKKQNLLDIRKKKVDGMILRSRSRWIQDGEKASKYFCNLEKRNFVQKCMNVLEREDGTVINDKDEILNETCQFYEKLYASREAELLDVDLSSIAIENHNQVVHASLDDFECAVHVGLGKVKLGIQRENPI